MERRKALRELRELEVAVRDVTSFSASFANSLTISPCSNGLAARARDGCCEAPDLADLGQCEAILRQVLGRWNMDCAPATGLVERVRARAKQGAALDADDVVYVRGLFAVLEERVRELAHPFEHLLRWVGRWLHDHENTHWESNALDVWGDLLDRIERVPQRLWGEEESRDTAKAPEIPPGDWSGLGIRILEALYYNAYTGEDLARYIGRPWPTVRDALRKGKPLRCVVDNKRGLGYYRKDARPGAEPEG